MRRHNFKVGRSSNKIMNLDGCMHLGKNIEINWNIVMVIRKVKNNECIINIFKGSKSGLDSSARFEKVNIFNICFLL